MTSLEIAYQEGVKLAMAEVGLVKESDENSIVLPALFPGLGGAIAAPEGKAMAGFGGSSLGSLVGAPLGALAGTLGGLGVSRLLHGRVPGKLIPTGGMKGGTVPLNQKRFQAMLLGALGGGALGGGAGSAIGYRKAMED